MMASQWNLKVSFRSRDYTIDLPHSPVLSELGIAVASATGVAFDTVKLFAGQVAGAIVPSASPALKAEDAGEQISMSCFNLICLFAVVFIGNIW